MLTLGKAELNLGRLDRETVKALWASLTVELLYLTNDDDERYSIQVYIFAFCKSAFVLH